MSQTNNKYKKVFGIDLGTTNSSIGYVDENNNVVVIPNAESDRSTPSVILFEEDKAVIGIIAKENSKIYPEDVVSYVKRSLGEPDFLYTYNSNFYRAEELSSFILKKLVQDAQNYLNEEITDVVITCPAYFGINEREATKRCGEIAGLNVLSIINEPTAAAIDYGLSTKYKEKVVLIFDLGGGTFDVTMIDIKHNSIKVICTGGDHNLGGKDWDDRIVSYFVNEFQEITGVSDDLLDDPDTCQDLQLIAEKTKKLLTTRSKTPVAVTYAGKREKIEITRDKFEEITNDLVERTINFTKQMLEQAQIKGYNKFDDIILVGGSTRMPQIVNGLQKEFKVQPTLYNPEVAIVKGAAIYAKKLATEKQANNKDQIDKNNIYNFKIQNITSKSFGIVVKDPKGEDVIFNLVLRNTLIPVKITKAFNTSSENQKTVLLKIAENETNQKVVSSDEATEIGTAVLNLPPNLPNKVPIAITFNINAEGRLSISAVESGSKRLVNVEIKTPGVIFGKDFDKAKIRCKDVEIQ